MPKTSLSARQRSRAYPAIPLAEAISLLRKLNLELGRRQSNRDTIAQALGYAGGNSGIAARKTAALSHFGLLNLRDGLYSPTGLAEDILDEGNEPRYRAALRESCLSPTLFREIIRRYEPVGRIPRQLALTLSLDHGIQEQARDEVAHIFMESARFAWILESDGTFRAAYFGDANRPLPLVTEAPTTPFQAVAFANKHLVASPPSEDIRSGQENHVKGSVHRFEVTDHKEIAIHLPPHLNEQDILLLRAQVDFLELRVKANRPDQPVRFDVYRDKKR